MCKYDKEEQINGMASDKDFSIPNMSTAIMEGEGEQNTMSKYDKVMEVISIDPDKVIDLLNKELSMPNVPTATMGGETFWNNLAEYNGWRLQQNMFTKHARILRPDNVRVAWGTVEGMYKALDRLVEAQKEERYTTKVSPQERQEAVARLKEIKELYDLGILTKEEYESKKAEVNDLI